MKWKLIAVHLEIVLTSVQDSIPSGTIGVVGQVEACFSSSRDSVNLDAR